MKLFIVRCAVSFSRQSFACRRQTSERSNSKPGLDAITPDGLLAQSRSLPRMNSKAARPGSKGEDFRSNTSATNSNRSDLKPGNPDGTYIQKVPLAGITSDAAVSFAVGGKTTDAEIIRTITSLRLRDCRTKSKSRTPTSFSSATASSRPEYGWDDYKDVDVRGKTILMLINDPPIPDPKDPTKLDEKMFKGRAMTYYGRWTYKYEIAAQKGAAAAIIIHETGAGGLSVFGRAARVGRRKISSSMRRTRTSSAVPVRSWITLDVAKKLLADCGQDFEALKKAAITKDFRPVALDGEGELRYQTDGSLIQIAQCHRQTGRQRSEAERTNTSFTARTGITSANIPSCRAIRFSTARWITRPGSRP